MKKLSKVIVFLSLLTTFNAHAFNTKAEHAILMDYKTGNILFDKKASEQMTPSSMTKLMTVYLLFERLQKGIFKLDDKFTVSEKAWRMGGSKMFLRHTERVSIEELINGIIVQSGNDACITVAEAIASTEEEFVNLMNEKAKELGMEKTNFINSTGWPDENHYMSAKDIAILSQRIINDFPEFYAKYFHKTEYTHADIKQRNRNMLLGRTEGVDGLKTGHTDDAGYGISASAIRDGKRLIAVVNGLSSDLERADEAEKLLNYGYRYFDEKVLFQKGQTVDAAKVWQGQSDMVNLTTNEEIKLLVPKLKIDDIEVNISYNSPLIAPVHKGQEVGILEIVIPDMGSHSYKLVVADSVEKAGILSLIMHNISEYIKGN